MKKNDGSESVMTKKVHQIFSWAKYFFKNGIPDKVVNFSGSACGESRVAL
jgi:hypothetical protein